MLSRLGILVLFISLITISSAHAQTSPLSQQQNETRWSVSLQGGFAMGASASMRESYTQFQSDVEKDYNNSGYPFGGPNGSGGSWDLSAEYDFLTSPFGIYAAVRTTLFSTSDASNNTADLSAGTLSLGAQYSHPFWRAFDFVVQGGINGSLLGARLSMKAGKQKLPHQITVSVWRPVLGSIGIRGTIFSCDRSPIMLILTSSANPTRLRALHHPTCSPHVRSMMERTLPIQTITREQ